MDITASIQDLVAETDIYLLDQILKKRYHEKDKILDAGCGADRNMHWFIQNGVDIRGLDCNEEIIHQLKSRYSHLPEEQLLVSLIEKMPYPDNYFNHVISSAVLHFAKSTAQFNSMFSGMVRVLKPGGSLFIRMTSDIGIENHVSQIADGVYAIPDGSIRFLLTRSILADLMLKYKFSFIEPLKTVNVNDIRCMSTLVLQKN